MSEPLSARTVALVKKTAPALALHGTAITRAMYDRLFENAEIRVLFNQSHHGGDGAQTKALAVAVLAYAQNIDNLGALGPTVERIAQKHVGLQIAPEHYPFVATALLGAIKQVLGEAATEEILGAWGEAYWFLANLLIGREKTIYGDRAQATGGWAGWRDFVIESRTREGEIITSFVLRPADGGPVLRHKPGQYLTFRFDLPAKEPYKRNYSISSAPNGLTYRISVKREPDGAVSNWLHDHAVPGQLLHVAAPSGDFFLPDRPVRPVVLLSGGVGLTPMISMLETIAASYPELETHYIHGTLDGSTHAMGGHVRRLAASRPGISTTIFYQAPKPADIAGRDYDLSGVITADWLGGHTPVATGDYFLCGPRPFLKAMVAGLAESGVGRDRIHFEFFGPADELI